MGFPVVTESLEAIELHFETKRDWTYGVIRRAILMCDLLPGQHFTVREIVEKVGVSPSPVREALSRLQGEGLVQSVSSKGFKVIPLTRELALEITVVVSALLPVAVREAGHGLPDETITRLQNVCRDGHERLAQHEAGLIAAPAIQDFHRILIDAGGHPFLNRTLRGAQDMSAWAARAVMRSRPELAWTRFALSLQSHDALMEALLSGNPEAIELVTREHYAQSAAWLLAHIPAATSS